MHRLFAPTVSPDLITVEQDIKPIYNFPNSYGRLAAYMDSDPDFFMSRKFGWLHARAILDLLDQLSRLEDRLVELHEIEFSSDDDNPWFVEKHWASGGSVKRQEILETIRNKLEAYDKLFLNANRMHTFKRPNMRHQNGMKILIRELEETVREGSQWIYNGRDLVALHDEAQQGGFHGWLERRIGRISQPAARAIFRTRDQHLQTIGREDMIWLYSHFRMGILVRSVITVLRAALLFIPVYLLPTTEKGDWKNANQVILLSAFTLTFSAFCAVFTEAGAKEINIATAAYAAVLVIYIGCLG